MQFFNSWAIGFGAAAILLPVLIHFFTRPRPKSMPLSTIRFVQAAIKQRRAKSWLRDALVLALRGLAIGCLAFAFAKPLLNPHAALPEDQADTDARVKRVVILDASQSMAASRSGVDGFQSARVQARQFLKSSTGLRANLIIADAQPAGVFDAPSANMKVLTDALSNANAAPESMDVQAAINSAAQMLTQEEGAQEELSLELVVVSDFQRTNWATVDFSVLPAATKIRLESTARTESLDNVAILSAGFSERPTAGGTATLEVTVGNYSRLAKPIKVQVSWADQVFTLERVCPPNVRTVLTRDVPVQQVGWQTGWARLLDNEDALAVDDAYPFVLEAIDTPAATIVTRQPPGQRPSSSYFLQRALAPFDSEQSVSQMVVYRISPTRMSSESLSESELLVFDHPGQLQAAQIKLLATLLRRGRGVLYVASEPVDANNLKSLSEELGSDWQSPVSLAPPARGASRRDLTISRVQKDERPFRVFGDSLTALLSELKFSGGLATTRIAGSLDDDILATLGDQSTLLFMSPTGLGNLCVLNADLNESVLPRHPVFVPLLNELVDALLRSNSSQQKSLCGEPLTRLLPAGVSLAADLEVAVNNGSTGADPGSAKVAEDRGGFRQSGDGVLWEWQRLTGPAAFQVRVEGENVYALASHVPLAESDLRMLDAEVMTERLAGGRDVTFRRSQDAESERDDSWIWFAVATVLALVSEVFVLNSFRM